MKLRNGTEVTVEQLNAWEYENRSESEIASLLGISRMALYEARKRWGLIHLRRSDKGVHRIDLKEKRLRKNAYMRQYAKEHYRLYMAEKKEYWRGF